VAVAQSVYFTCRLKATKYVVCSKQKLCPCTLLLPAEQRLSSDCEHVDNGNYGNAYNRLECRTVVARGEDVTIVPIQNTCHSTVATTGLQNTLLLMWALAFKDGE
jgi:hypothetical protein